MDKDKNPPKSTVMNAGVNAMIFNKKYQNIEDVYNAYGGGSFKLDLGCGYVKPSGFIGLDNLSGEASQIPNTENAPDILMNLDRGAFPFPDNSCEEVRSSHFLEHSQLMHILSESHRVLRPAGTFLFAVPYANSAEGMYPGHQQFLTEKWFYKNLNFQRYFKIESEEYFPSDDYLKLPLILRTVIPFKFARTFLFNACWQMIFPLLGQEMKVAYLIPGCGVSGGIAVVCQHVNRLLSRGHEVMLVSETDERTIDWFPNQLAPIVGLQNFPADLDVLVATAWSTAFRVAVLPAKHKFYFVQSDETRFHPKDSAWEHITRLSYSMGYNYLTEARWIRQWLSDGFGHNAELVPNGLDAGIFFPAEPIAPKGTRPRVLLEGAIGLPYKGMAEAFEAVQDIDVEVWCVSSFGKPVKTWRCDRFFEQVPMTEMRRIYSSCDILVKLSRVEGFFGPPMEMMACGGAVIVGEVTGYDEYIENEVNALVVDPLKPEQAATAIRRLIADAGLRDKLLANGKLTAARWEWDASIDILERYFVDVVEGSRGLVMSRIKADLARSAAFFYGQLRGVDLAASFTVAGTGPLEAEFTTSEESVTQDVAAAQGAFQNTSRLIEMGATDKLLAWLRKKRWFRVFAVASWRCYCFYGAMTGRRR